MAESLFPLYEVVFRRPDDVPYQTTWLQTNPTRELFASDHGLKVSLGGHAITGLGNVRPVPAEERAALGDITEAQSPAETAA